MGAHRLHGLSTGPNRISKAEQFRSPVGRPTRRASQQGPAPRKKLYPRLKKMETTAQESVYDARPKLRQIVQPSSESLITPLQEATTAVYWARTRKGLKGLQHPFILRRGFRRFVQPSGVRGEHSAGTPTHYTNFSRVDKAVTAGLDEARAGAPKGSGRPWRSPPGIRRPTRTVTRPPGSHQVITH